MNMRAMISAAFLLMNLENSRKKPNIIQMNKPMCNPDIANKCIAPAALNEYLVSCSKDDLSPKKRA